MFSSFLPLGIPKFGFGKTAEIGTPVKIPSVQVHDSETASDKRGRSLKHLLKLNHVNFSILYVGVGTFLTCPFLMQSFLVTFVIRSDK
jgi:hypothetical protein